VSLLLCISVCAEFRSAVDLCPSSSRKYPCGAEIFITINPQSALQQYKICSPSVVES